MPLIAQAVPIVFPIIGFVAFATIFFGGVIAVGIHMVRRVSVGGRSYKNLAAFMDDFSRQTGYRSEPVHGFIVPRLPDARFTGEVRGRRVEVSFTTNATDRFYAHVRVAADKAPHLAVSRKGVGSWIDKALGLKKPIETGEPGFDERFLVESLETERGKKAAQSAALREAIESLYAHFQPYKFESVRGQIAVTIPADALHTADVGRLAERLAEIAEQLDSVKVHSTAATLEHARCGYCHEDVAPGADDLLACEVCRTVMHKGCRAELGRCAVAGCGGQAPVKAHVRG